MQFTNIEFIVFFIILLFLFLACPRNSHRRFILLGANYYFYACWDYRFLALIIAQTSLEFFLGRALDRSESLRGRKALLICSIVLNIGVLFYFKYLSWFIGSFASLFPFANKDSHFIKLILPLGLSFYTFRLLTYSIDIYRKNMRSSDSFVDFAIYVSFFPIIISGPIARASEVLPQIRNISVSHKSLYAGLRLFAIGLFLKVFVADNVGMFVNFFYENHAVFNSLSAWMAFFAYSLQIYADFAGYSSMAIGISSIIGIQVNDNFNYPYLSINIKEFWKRWHISLSTWIRDYIYIPLGGSRRGRLRTYINLIFTMTLCGLWHGAGFNYIFWGFLHGVYLVINDVFLKARKGRYDSNISGLILTYLSVSVAWVFFRAESFEKAIMILKQLVLWQNGVAWYPPFIIFILIAALVVNIMKISNISVVDLELGTKYALFLLFCMFWLTVVFTPKVFQPFVYAQF